LRAVKDIGANSVGEERTQRPARTQRLAAVQAAYERHRTPAGLPARYDVILAYARK
jgi:malonyl-CoA O-methyltransferase